MIALLLDVETWLVIIILSFLGSFGRVIKYQLGKQGKDRIVETLPRIGPETWDKVLAWHGRLGVLVLLVASLPIVGTLVSVGAGMQGVGRGTFIFWVTVSKVIRNWLLVFLYLLLAGRALDIQF